MTAKPLPSTPPLLISERETARLLGISQRTVFTLAAGGKLPYVKIGRLKKFAVADINAFIAVAKIGGGA